MSVLGGRRLGAAAVLALAVAGCEEHLTQPGECPELCPGGIPQALEEVLTALPGRDTSFTGYVAKASNGVLLVSSGIPTAADTNFAVIEFGRRSDSIQFRDTLRAYTIDSIRLSVGLIARDTAVRNLQILLYRLPSNPDTTALSYTGVRPSFTPANLIAAIPVADTLRRGDVPVVFRDSADLARLAFAPGDSNRLVMGVAVSAPVPTGVRIGTGTTGVPPAFTTYVKPIVENPGNTSQVVPVGVQFNTYVSRAAPAPDPLRLPVGGAPSSRGLIRFPWPAKLKDSVTIVRATLELVPAEPVRGLPHDPGTLEADVIASDLGAKSPICPVSLPCGGTLITKIGQIPLPAGTTDTVRIEVTSQVRAWQGSTPAPPAVFVSITPEAATFTEAVFGSTRSGAPARLRVDYQPRFPFEKP